MQDHLFLHCPVVREYWNANASVRWLGTHLRSSSVLSLFRELRNNVTLPAKKIITSIWSIWKTRNAHIFRQSPVSSMGIYSRAFRILTEWNMRTRLDSLDVNINNNSLSKPPRTMQVAWTPPTPGIVKINFDGSVRNNSGSEQLV
ncbi:uncharacterized protein [Spinacia oleracea]|uniref:Reverse transcriptase zinc-binding domain-containing protein n=1 Tax=Spinacia oleracea TaxID=3562 RepID=A0ABM3R918_SPIOL|nr:uncharacterized protein LOC130467591 [Spinacia oleracea]